MSRPNVMTAADDMKPYIDMQLVGTHLGPNGELILELGPPGRQGRSWVSIVGDGLEAVRVEATVDPPAPRYRNRRGPTVAPDYETWAQRQIDQGDDQAERDREQNDDRYDVT